MKSNKKQKVLYMDYASSAKPNPSAIHKQGVLAKQKLENARKIVADILHCRPKEVIFTSSGTESNNLAILGFLENTFDFKPHVIVSNIEHPSVLDTVKYLEKIGKIELSVVGVEQNGIINPVNIKKEIKENTVLVSVMYVNNEIGTIQPLREIAKNIRHYKKHSKKNSIYPIFHTDAVQAINYLDLEIEKLGVDMMTLSGAKLFLSTHVGVLYKKSNITLSPIMHGGLQEFGLRPGTENTESINIFAKYFCEVRNNLEKKLIKSRNLRDYFFFKLNKLIINSDFQILINGDLKERLPNNVNITIKNIPSDLLVLELDARGIYVSSKSACKSGDGKASHVLEALGQNIKDTDGSVRFSFGPEIQKKDIDFVINSLETVLKKIGKWYTH